MHEADALILAVAEYASKGQGAPDRIQELNNINAHANVHQISAGVLIQFLYLFDFGLVLLFLLQEIGLANLNLLF